MIQRRFMGPLALLLTLAGAAPATAQSFIGVQAFGLPIEPLEARSIGAGNLGIGLRGLEMSALDPTAGAWVPAPTVGVSMQPTWGDFTLGTEAGSSNWTRFPLVAIVYPVVSLGGTVTLSLGEALEQRWVAEVESVSELGGVSVPATDRFESEGGSSVARLGWIHRFGTRLAVGAVVGAYVGRLDQSFSRTLDSLAVGGNIQPFVDGGAWRYSGKTLTLGASADPSDLLHVAGAVEWSTDLEATPQEGTSGEGRSFGVPMKLSAGATGTLTPRLHLNASVRMQDWSGADGLANGEASDQSLSYGVGLEWRALQRETRSVPLRFGYRSVGLPYKMDGTDMTESAITMGLGLNFLETDGLRFGWLDVAMERGSRTGASLDETFWRATFSLGISGF
ncbi:MAG: hypothetical protein HKN73_06530 [Gemmatimonadetes bacterium]|nr:hypothetical protein [Gemmatimonadota bacterium]